jgi:hypothetical protein
MESTGLTALGGSKDFWLTGRAAATWKPFGVTAGHFPSRSVGLAGGLGDG